MSTIDSLIDQTASELVSLRYDNANLNREIGSLQQRLQNVTTALTRIANEHLRQRNVLKQIENVTGRCDDGEAGTCGNCSYCLARIGLWGCL